MFSKRPLSSISAHRKRTCKSLFPHACYTPVYLTLPGLDYSSTTRRATQISVSSASTCDSCVHRDHIIIRSRL